MNKKNREQDEIRKFLIANFPLYKQTELSDNESLLENGIIDSMGILEIVNFLNDYFGLEVTDEDLIPENFDSVIGISNFVRTKQNLLN